MWGATRSFLWLTMPAGVVVEGLGVVRAVLGEGLEQRIGMCQQATQELT